MISPISAVQRRHDRCQSEVNDIDNEIYMKQVNRGRRPVIKALTDRFLLHYPKRDCGRAAPPYPGSSLVLRRGKISPGEEEEEEKGGGRAGDGSNALRIHGHFHGRPGEESEADGR